MLCFALISNLILLNTVDEFYLSWTIIWRADACWKDRYFSGMVNNVPQNVAVIHFCSWGVSSNGAKNRNKYQYEFLLLT